MKKFYLFFAGSLLALPALAQVDKVDPEFDPQNDPKVIFTQDFEADFQTWADSIVDTIDGVWYYKATPSSSSQSHTLGEGDWVIYPEKRDCVIYLKNGVSISNNISDNDGERLANIGDKPAAFANDDYTIKEDQTGDRQEAFSRFGENAGTHYFQYTSDHKLINTSSDYSSGVVPAYRRCLFVRGLPIEDETSYRLTLFLRARNFSDNVTTTFSADVMRGYFNSEKPFTISGESGAAEFTSTKTEFLDDSKTSDQWEKITLMTYYINDSIANQYMHRQYYWYNEQWAWGIGPGANDTLHYIVQPDNFFVRLAFRSDSTEFSVDNIALTKSWIGGVQHYKDKIRVDMGYETNLDDLAEKARALNNIDQVVLPGEYFSVYGYVNDEEDPDASGWYKVDIRTAEYHGDGYLYMWVKPIIDDEGDEIPIDLDEYFEKVLVNFDNPVDDENLRLYYTGKGYPMANNAEWVENGKLLLGFKNEVSTPNPFVFDGVYDLANLPPVLQGYQYEKNSFGLDPAMSELTIKLSRKIAAIPNVTEAEANKPGEETGYCQVTKLSDPDFKEIWTIKGEATDSNATFVRPAGGEPLDGEYQFEFFNLRGATTDIQKNTYPVVYEFGAINKNPEFNTYVQTNFAEGEGNDVQCVPVGLAIWDKNNGFTKGYVTGTKSRMYPCVASEDNGNSSIAIYVSSRGLKTGGHLYYGYDSHDSLQVHLTKGKYTLSFRAANWDNYEGMPDREVYIFSKDLSDNPQTTAVAKEDKILIGKFNPTASATSGNIQSSTPSKRTWENEPYTFSFDIEEEGYYILEWVTYPGASGNAVSYGGFCMTDFTVSDYLSISESNVLLVNDALEGAETKIGLVEGSARDYKGQAYTDFVAEVNGIKATIYNETAPSKYAAAAADVIAASKAIQARMDTVDLFYDAMASVDEALATYSATFAGVEAYTSLEALKAEFAGFTCSDIIDGAEIKEAADALNEGVAALADRVEKTNKVVELIAEIEENLGNDTTEIYPGLMNSETEEYEILSDLFDEVSDPEFDFDDLSDDDFNNLYANLVQANKDYKYAPDQISARTRQARELYALAVKLGSDFGGQKALIDATIATIAVRDTALENVLREAVILEIYKLGKTGSLGFDTLDVSALLPNYFLYTEGVADVDMAINNGVWSVKIIDGGNSTAIPDWTISEIKNSGSNWLPTTVAVGKGDGKMDWEAEGHAFAGGLRCGPHTAGTIVTTNPKELPAGYYWIGANAYNQTSNVNVTIAADNGTLYSGNIGGLSKTTKDGKKFGYEVVGKDSLLANGNLSITIRQSSDSGSEFDIRNFVVLMRGLDPAANYVMLEASQTDKLNDLLEGLTFVDSAAEVVADQYFNLSGAQIDGPQAGQIVIKRSLKSNGEYSVNKMLSK